MALATGVSSWTLATTPAASAVPLTESGQAGFFPSLRLSKRSHHLYRQLQTPSLRDTLNTWCALIVLSVAVFAGADEPPSIERLIPTGGQRGTSVDVKFIGKAGDGQLKTLTEADSLSFAVAEDKQSAVVTIAASARPGIHWLRFCNEFGATELKPYIVGLIPESTEAEPNARIVEAQTVVLPSVTINGSSKKPAMSTRLRIGHHYFKSGSSSTNFQLTTRAIGYHSVVLQPPPGRIRYEIRDQDGNACHLCLRRHGAGIRQDFV